MASITRYILNHRRPPEACRLNEYPTHTLIQAFAQTQAMKSFDKQFGEYNPAKGAYAIPTKWLSLMNGLPFIGFAIGMHTSNHYYICRLTNTYTHRLFRLACWQHH